MALVLLLAFFFTKHFGGRNMRLFKKMTALLTALVFLLIPACAVDAAPASSIELVPLLSKVSRDILIPALPFVSSNSGLSMLEDALAKHQIGANAGILGSVIEKALEHTDAKTLQRGLDSLYAFDEDFRQECQSIYQNCVPISLNSAEKQGVAILVHLIERDEPGFESVMTQHQISDGMIANFLSAFVTFQNGSGMLSQNKDGSFVVKKHPVTLINELDAIWQGSENAVTVRETIDKLILKLNTELSDTERSSVASLFLRTGLLSTAGIPEKEVEPLPEKQEGVYSELETPKYPDALLTFEVLKDGIIFIPGEFTQPVIYRLTSAGTEPVKMALYLDGAIVAELSKGQYLVKEASPYFADCNGWVQPYVEALYARGIIGGKAEHLFMPEDWITREEFVKLVIELFDMVDYNAKTSFSDVSSEAWYYPYVASAQQYGIVNGISETEFGVGQLIRRQDMAKIICDILQKKGLTLPTAEETVFADFSFVQEYARSQVLSAYALGIVSGDDRGNFNPRYFAKRSESAKMIYGMLKAILKRPA